MFNESHNNFDENNNDIYFDNIPGSNFDKIFEIYNSHE